MAATDKYLYNLISCGAHPSIYNKHTPVTPSPYENLIVYITNQVQSETYQVVPLGLNAALSTGNMPFLSATAFDICASLLVGRIYRVQLCSNRKTTRDVLLPISYAIGTVLRFTGEDTCWEVQSEIANYAENLTVDASFSSCIDCQTLVVDGICEYEERTIQYAVKVKLPFPEPPDRGFSECCYRNYVLADLGDTASYKNDYSSVFYKRQTPNDTVTFQLVGVVLGTVALVDSTHGILYPFGSVGQPDLKYFTVEWRKILALFGEDSYKIRMVLSIAGVAFTIDTFSYELRQFSQTIADKTVRIDSKLDGKLLKINTDFRNTGYKNSLRMQGFFGNRQANFEQDNVVFSSKNGLPYYEDQITMSNDWDYVFSAYQMPECLTRLLYNELLWGNQLFLSDYNLNNHSYIYEVLPAILAESNETTYNALSRLVNVSLTFKDRTKDNRKTNC